MTESARETARETLQKLGLIPDRWGRYWLGDYRLKFQKASIRVERRFRNDTGRGGYFVRLGTIFYGKIGPGDLERIVDRLKTELNVRNRAQKTKEDTPMATKKAKDIALEKANAKYIDHLKEEGKNARTVATYERLLGLAVQHFGADKPLSKLTPAQVGQFFKSDVMCRKPNGNAKSEITLVQTRRVFRMMLVWACEAGHIADVPVPKAEMEHARSTGAGEEEAEEAGAAAQAG